MRWYIIMMPFITIFLFCGFKWQIYQQQISNSDYIGLNSVYSSINVNKLRTYQADILTDELIYQLVKYIAVETEYKSDYTIGLSVLNQKIPALAISIKTDALDSNMEIQRAFIMESHQ